MPSNPIARLEEVAAGLGRLASELEQLYGEPTPNLLYWRREILDAIDALTASAGPGATPPHQPST